VLVCSTFPGAALSFFQLTMASPSLVVSSEIVLSRFFR
jgi:hypothetical protein